MSQRLQKKESLVSKLQVAMIVVGTISHGEPGNRCTVDREKIERGRVRMMRERIADTREAVKIKLRKK